MWDPQTEWQEDKITGRGSVQTDPLPDNGPKHRRSRRARGDHRREGGSIKKLPAGIIAVGLVLSACTTRTDGQIATTAEPATPDERAEPVETDPEPLSPDVAITANPGFDVEGEAAVRKLDEGRTRIAIEIRGAPSNSMLPWHVHQGRCGSGGPVIGDPTAYPPLAAGQDGSAAAETTIDLSLEPDADYHINVHRSPSEMDTILACGEIGPV